MVLGADFNGRGREQRIRNKVIRGTGRLGEKAREVRLRWFGLVQRTDSRYIGRSYQVGGQEVGRRGDLWML